MVERSVTTRVAATAGLLLLSSTLSAQVPGAPALQSAFSSPGLVVAGNFGSSTGQTFYGGAAGYGLGANGRIFLSAAAGAQRANEATRGAYGARAAMSVWTSRGGALGASAFAGVGGAMRTKAPDGTTTNPQLVSLPLGVSVGYRRAMGQTRGISAYVSPMYKWTRAEADGIRAASGAMGVAIAGDVALSRSFGLTIGTELGRTGTGTGRKTTSVLGVAVSFVPRR